MTVQVGSGVGLSSRVQAEKKTPPLQSSLAAGLQPVLDVEDGRRKQQSAGWSAAV